MRPAAPAPRRTGLLGRSVAAAGMALAVLAGASAAAAAPQGPAAAQAVDVARTVRVDPRTCAQPSGDPAVTVVCTVDEVAAHLIDRTSVVLSGVRHRGPLDLRGRAGVTVRGETGAVLDAAGAASPCRCATSRT